MNHYWEVTKHRAWVLWYTLVFCRKLIIRALKHDLSKFSKKEAPYFIENTPKLKTLTYGSEEYKKCLEDLKPALKNHYYKNSHHPEYYVDGFKNMSALDRIEMVFDWLAATKRTNGGDITKSLEVNEKRFNYTEKDTEWLIAIIRDVKKIE